MKNLLDFIARFGREDIVKQTVWSDSLHHDSNDYVVRIVHIATSKNLGVKSTMFPHQNISKYK
jgi:hypothetical protein